MKLPKISPIIKVNYLCNFGCWYCYYSGFEGRERSRMSVELADLIMRRAAEYNKAAGETHIKFYWHGGEPTLNDLDFFKQVVELQQHLSIEVHNSIQTNASIIDDAWIAFFKENAFGVGVSIDGPAAINDVYRIDRSGKGTTKVVLEHIQMMQKAGLEVGVLSVISPHSNAEQLYQFYAEHDLDSVGFCKSFVAREGAPDPLRTLNPEGLASFLRSFFDLYFRGTYPLEHREFETAIRSIVGCSGDGVCTMSGRSSCGMFPTVNAEGDVFFCDDYDLVNDAVLGNIYRESFIEILGGEAFRRKKSEVMSVFTACRQGCEVASICGGGCPRHDIDYGGLRKNYFCDTFRNVYKHLIGTVAAGRAMPAAARIFGATRSEQKGES